MTVGKTHSGKTTFGNLLAQEVENPILFDSDVMMNFLEKTYPWLSKSKVFPLVEKNTSSVVWSVLESVEQFYPWEKNGILSDKEGFLKPDTSLHMLVRLFVLDTVMRTDDTVLLTSSHGWKEIRTTLSTMIQQTERKSIMVYFNYPEEFLLERIKKSERNAGERAEDFLLREQRQTFEPPTPDEADFFFEITDEVSLDKAK
jgi:shikimate kinase